MRATLPSNDNLKPHQEPFHVQNKYEPHHHQRQHYRNHRKQPSYSAQDTNEASFFLQPYYPPLSRFSTPKQRI